MTDYVLSIGAWKSNALSSASWATTAWRVATSYVISGQSDFIYNKNLTATQNSYAISGNTAFKVNKVLSASVNSVSIPPQNIEFQSTTYEIYGVNLTDSVVDNQTDIQIYGVSFTGSDGAAIEYAVGSALKPGAFGPNVWQNGAWSIGGTRGALADDSWAVSAWQSNSWATANDGILYYEPLLNINVVNNDLITADMFDVETSGIPFTDSNHTLHRLAVYKASAYTYRYIQVLPTEFYIVGTIQPTDANTDIGRSIFGGLSLISDQQVLLPVSIGGYNTTWETKNGNVTGRFTLSGNPITDTSLTIPIWSDVSGWDVINVTVKDISTINTNLLAENNSYTITGQNIYYKRNYVLNSQPSVFEIKSNVDLKLGVSLVVAPIVLNTSLESSLVAKEITINSVRGLGPNKIQVGSQFFIEGVGFGNTAEIDVVLTDFLGMAVECRIDSITNSSITAFCPAGAGALSAPNLIRIHVGDYERDVNGNIIISGTNPIPISSRYTSKAPIQIAVFSTNSLSLATSLVIPTITQQSLLGVESIYLNTLIDQTGFTSNSNLSVNNLTLSTVLEVPNLIQKNILTNSSLSLATSLTSPTVTQSYQLSVNSISCNTLLSNLQVYDNYLSNNNLSLSVTLTQPTVIQNNILTVNSLSVVSRLNNTLLVQKSGLIANDLTVSTGIDSVSLTYKAYINSNNMLLGTGISNSVLLFKTDIQPDNLNLYTQLFNSSLTNTYSVTTNSLTLSTSLNNTTLSQQYKLKTDRIKLSSKLSKAVVTKHFNLSVNDLKLKTKLSNSRAKIVPDGISIKNIQIVPAISGYITIN